MKISGEENSRSSRNFVSAAGTSVPDREDVESWSEYIHALTEVAEVGPLVSDSGSSDSDCVFGSGRGVRASVTVIVTSLSERVSYSVSARVKSHKMMCPKSEGDAKNRKNECSLRFVFPLRNSILFRQLQ